MREETVKTRLHRAKKLMREQLETKLGSVLTDTFPFQDPRCAAFTDALLARLAEGGAPAARLHALLQQAMEESHDATSDLNLSRRQSFKALAGAGLCATAGPSASSAQGADIKDEDIFQFALNLEYMETEYYLRATTGQGIDAADAGSDPGAVKGGHKVPFQSKAIREFAEELAENELAHVRFYRKTLGKQAVSRPAIDFEAGFAAAAKGAGLPEFDPFANEMNFLLGGMLFEDVGVTAYAGRPRS